MFIYIIPGILYYIPGILQEYICLFYIYSFIKSYQVPWYFFLVFSGQAPCMVVSALRRAFFFRPSDTRPTPC